MVALSRAWLRPVTAAALFLSMYAAPAGTATGVPASGEARTPRRVSAFRTAASPGRAPHVESRGGRPGGVRLGAAAAHSQDFIHAAGVDAFALGRDGGRLRNASVTRSDWREAEAVLDAAEGDVFWFRLGEDRYVVTDPDAILTIVEMFRPQEELGRRQGELGQRQGELGRFQGELGRQQGRLARIQAQLGMLQAQASLQRARRDWDTREANDLRRELDAIRRGQREAGELQSELGAQQRALGERQRALGERQEELGREQRRVARERADALGRLTREMIADGRAERIRR